MSKKIYSNLDIDLSDEARFKGEKDERNTELVDRKIKESEDYKSHGLLNPRHATVSKAQDEWSASDVRARRASGKPVLPAFVVEQPNGDVTYILTDSDREAVMEGYICENCLGWQESNLTLGCKTIRGFSCNYTRGL